MERGFLKRGLPIQENVRIYSFKEIVETLGTKGVFFSKEIFMLVVHFLETGLRDEVITRVVCRAGLVTGDRMGHP